MHEARQRERLRTAAAANRRLGFINIDLQSSAGEDDGGGEAIRTRTDNNRVWFGQVFAISLSYLRWGQTPRLQYSS